MMKRISCLLLVFVMLAGAACASAEAFELEHGIRFGMTREEVIEKVGAEPENYEDKEAGFFSYKDVEAEGCEHSNVDYRFDEQGRLVCVYENLHKDLDAGKLEKNFNTVKKELQKLYGKPLGNKKGKTDELASESLKLAFTNEQVAKASKSQTKLSYNEWKVETDGGIVKIDQYYSMVKYKAIKMQTQDHVICYTFFPNE